MSWSDKVIESTREPWTVRNNEGNGQIQCDVRECVETVDTAFGFLTADQQAAVNMALQLAWNRGYKRAYEGLSAKVEEAFYDGYASRSTYNDKDVSDVDEAWRAARAGLLRIA